MQQIVRRRGALVTVGAVLTLLVSVSRPAALPQEQDPITKTRLKEVRPLVSAVYAALRGRLAPTARPFGWANDFFKGQAGNTYVPFTLTIDRAKISTSTVAMYVLVTPRQAAMPVRTGPQQNNPEPEEIQDPPPPAVAFEAVYFIDLDTEQAGDAYRISRAFSLPAGDYDVYVALATEAMMIKQDLSVPNLWTTQLSTSTVVVADRIEPLAAPLTPEPESSDPYALGTVRIVPAGRADFQRTEQLSVIFFVYNPGLTSDRKPDVTVDYLLYQRGPDGERYFSRTTPQTFNAKTLAGFDIDAGHQLVGGQAMPLGAFPAGAYRLEIKVTDNTRGSTVTRHVDFAVH